MREKKICRGDWLGYCPFFSNCDTGLDKHGLGDMPGRAAGARKGRVAGARKGRAAGARMVGHDTAS